MEKELKKVVNERFENGTLHTEVDKDDLISLNEIGLVVFKKLTLNDCSCLYCIGFANGSCY